MNKAAEKIAAFLGSAPVIIGFGLWTLAHAFLSQDYVSTVSDLAIEIGFLILRAEIVQGDRLERYIKEATRASKKDLKLTNAIMSEIEDLRYQK